MRKIIQTEIIKNEKLAIADNKQKQQELNAAAKLAGTPRTCFEGELYGVVNNPTCARQFKNTYVTNVGYRDIMNKMLPQLLAGGFTQYSPN
jgi:hypothetical protein